MKPLGVCLCLAGLALGVVAFRQAKKQTELGQLILEQVGARENPSTEEAAAVAQLYSTSLNTRVAFLDRAMNTDAERLRVNEPGLSIALSRVKSSDAGALFRRAILPTLTTSSDAKALLEGDAFVRRWSISQSMSHDERDALASQLIERMYAENNRDSLNALATVLSGIAKGVDPKTAGKLSRRLMQRISHDHDARSREALIAGLAALEQSEGLIDTLLQEEDSYGLQILSRDARDFEKNLTPAKADQLAQKLTVRLINELNPLAVNALVSLLEPLPEKLSSREMSDVASQLVERAYAEPNGATVQVLMSGLNVYAKNLDQAVAGQLVARLAARMDLEPSAELLAIFASGLASLPDKSDEKIAAHMVVRINKERDVANLESLAEALDALKEKAGERNIALAATTLVERMIREKDLDAMVTLSSAVEKLDGEVPQQESESLATEIVARVSAEANHSAILPLTMAIDALDEGIRQPKADELASKLLARMRVDHDPEVLRALVVGMRFLKDKISASKFDEAASILVAAMKVPQTPENLQILAFGLHSCIAKAGPDPFQQATAILIAHLAADPQTMVEALNGIQSRVAPEQMDHAAAILIDLIVEQTDTEKIRSLTANLASIADRIDAPAANRLASQLIARMAAEHNPELLRSFGNALGALPADSLNTVQIEHAFRIARAPCQIVLRVPSADHLHAVANEILNPFCSEDSWIGLAASLGKMTGQPIVRGTLQRETPELDFDGMGALKDDDDDEGKSKPGEAAAEPISVDFNLLSRVLDGIRPKDAFWSWQIGIDLLSAFLICIGLIVLVLPDWIDRRRAQG
ncbi:MAG: hypothetical protein ABSF22_24730 [Bryobacteraceae bacterium]